MGYDTTDWLLTWSSIVDGLWRWKDEDDLAEAVRLGVLDTPRTAEVRAIGQLVAASRPWPTGWGGLAATAGLGAAAAYRGLGHSLKRA